jgi:hypothetical protein
VFNIMEHSSVAIRDAWQKKCRRQWNEAQWYCEAGYHMGWRHCAVDFNALIKNAKTYHQQPLDVTAHAQHPCYIQNHILCLLLSLPPCSHKPYSQLQCSNSIPLSMFPSFTFYWSGWLAIHFPSGIIIGQPALSQNYFLPLYSVKYFTKCVHCLTASSSQNHEPWSQQIIKNQSVVGLTNLGRM